MKAHLFSKIRDAKTASCVVLGFAFFLTSQGTKAQTSILPKTPAQPDKVIVLDWNQASTPLATITCLQGVINRFEANKASGERRFIFIKNLPSTRFGGRTPAVWDGLLADGLVPYPLEEPTLSGSGQLLLDYMMLNFSQAVKGYVISPTDKAQVTGSVRAAALNVCSMEGSIGQGWPLMVSTPTYDYLVSQGYNKPVIANLETMNLTDIQAFDWSVARGHLTDSDRNNRISAFLGGYEMIMNDYFVMTGTFAWDLEKTSKSTNPTDAEADARILQQILPAYPAGAVHAGPTESGDVIQLIQNASQLAVTGWISNCSVLSAVPTIPAHFTRPIPPEALEVDPQGIYLAWRSNDGDAWDVADYFLYEQYVNPVAGVFPVGRTETAYILDLFPSLISWLSSVRNGELEITASLNDGGYPSTEIGKDAYYGIYKYYLGKSNGVFTSMHYLGGSNAKHAQVMSDFELPYVYMGYQGDSTPTVFELLDNTVYSNQTLERDRSVADSVVDIRNIIVNADPNKPVFLMLRENNDVADVAATYSGVINDPAILATGRPIFRTLPTDLAATWRSYYETRKEPLWSQNFEAAAPFSSMDRVPMPNLEGARGDWVGRMTSPGGGSRTAIGPQSGDFPISLPADALQVRIESWMAINGAEIGDLRLQLRVQFVVGTGTANQRAETYFFRDKVSDHFLRVGRNIDIPPGATAIKRIELRVVQENGGSPSQDVYFDDVSLYVERAMPVANLVNGDLDEPIEAEDYDQDSDGQGPTINSGIQAISVAGFSGGAKLANGSSGAWVRYANLDFGSSVESIEIAASNGSGSNRAVEFRSGGVDGDLVATINVPPTSGWNNTTVRSSDSLKLVGIRDVYLVMPDGRVDVDTFTLQSDPSGSIGGPVARVVGNQIEAETYDSGVGVTATPTAEPTRIGSIESGNHVRYDGFDFGTTGARRFNVALSSDRNGGAVEVRLGSLNGQLVGTASIDNTGGWNDFTEVSINLTQVVTGTQDLFLVFKGGSGLLLDVDWFEFETDAIVASGSDLNTLYQAEGFDSHERVVGIYNGGTGQKIGNIRNGDWVHYANFDLGAGASSYEITLSSDRQGGNVEFRLDSPTGPLIATVNQGGTDNWNDFELNVGTFDVPASQVSGVRELYLVFTGGSGSLLDVDWFKILSGTPPPSSTALYEEDFEGPNGFSSTFALDVNGNGVGRVNVPSSGNVTAKDDFGGPSGAIPVDSQTQQLDVQVDLQLPAAIQGTVAARMVVRVKKQNGAGTSAINGSYLDLDASAVGSFVTYSDTINLPNDVESILDVRLRVNQNTSGSGSQFLYFDNVRIEAN